MRLVKIIVLIYALLFSFVSCKLSDSSNEKEQVSYQIPIVESTTSSFQITNDKVKLSTSSFFIPQNFELESSNGELIFNAKDSSVQFTVEDKTKEISNFDDYIQDTITSLKQMGLLPEAVETTKIGNFYAKRFIVDTFDITNSNIRMFCYFIDMNDSKIIINVISKNSEIVDAVDADELVSSIKFE